MTRTVEAPAELAVGQEFRMFAADGDKVYRALSATTAVELCPYCDNGYRSMFAHVDNGRCYPCGGRVTITEEQTVSSIERLARNRANAAERKDVQRRARLAEADAARATLFAAHPAIATAYGWHEADAGAGEDSRLHQAARSVIERVRRFDFRELSAAQVAMVERAVSRVQDRAAERAADAERPAAPLGRQPIEGVVSGVKYVPNYYSYTGGEVRKITVTVGDGWRVFMTAPRSLDLDDEHLRGSTIALTVTLEDGAAGDHRFRLGKRPTKCRVMRDRDGNDVGSQDGVSSGATR